MFLTIIQYLLKLDIILFDLRFLQFAVRKNTQPWQKGMENETLFQKVCSLNINGNKILGDGMMLQNRINMMNIC